MRIKQVVFTISFKEILTTENNIKIEDNSVVKIKYRK
jgi:hypothetical protein